MKIVQIITLSEPFGGAQMVLYNIVERLRHKHEIFLIIGEEGRLTNELRKIGINCIIVESLQRKISISKDIKAYFEIKEILQKINPDIVSSHSSKAGLLARIVCHTLKLPNVFTAHGWSFTPGVSRKSRIIFLFLEKIAGFFTDHIITVSEFDKQLASINRIVKPEKIKVIHNGAPDLYSFKAKDNNHNIKGVMVARFQFQKDHSTLFMALSILKEKKIHIDLIGDGPKENEMKALAKQLDIENMLTFHGTRQDVPNFLNSADFFLLITNFEGLPLSICEAMSCGLPIVASDVGGIKEMVNHSENGYLIPRGSVSCLAESLDKLISNPLEREKMSKKSRSIYEEKFSIDQMVALTESYYYSILKK